MERSGHQHLCLASAFSCGPALSIQGTRRNVKLYATRQSQLREGCAWYTVFLQVTSDIGCTVAQRTRVDWGAHPDLGDKMTRLQLHLPAYGMARTILRGVAAAPDREVAQ